MNGYWTIFSVKNNGTFNELSNNIISDISDIDLEFEIKIYTLNNIVLDKTVLNSSNFRNLNLDQMLYNNTAYWLFYQRKNNKNNEFKQTLNLQEGVNFVSFYIVFNDSENINYLLNKNDFVVNDSIERISDGTTITYKGSKYGWVGSLQNFDNTNVFKFKLSKSVDITFFGNNFVQLPMKINYKKRITGIPCPYSNIVNLNNLSFSHLNDESYIYYSDPILSNAHWSSSIDSWVGDLSYIEPGRGYILNTTYDGELTFLEPE